MRVCPTHLLMLRQLCQRDRLVSPFVNIVRDFRAASSSTMTAGSVCVAKCSTMCAEQHTASGESEEVGDVRQCCFEKENRCLEEEEEEKKEKHWRLWDSAEFTVFSARFIN